MFEPCMIISTDTVPTNSAVMRPAISIYFSIRDARCWRTTSCNALRPSINAMAMMTAASTSAQAINRPMMTRALIVPGPISAGMAIAPARCSDLSFSISIAAGPLNPEKIFFPRKSQKTRNFPNRSQVVGRYSKSEWLCQRYTDLFYS